MTKKGIVCNFAGNSYKCKNTDELFSAETILFN